MPGCFVTTKEPFQRLVNQGMILAPAYLNAGGSYVRANEVVQRGGDYIHEPSDTPVERVIEKMGKSKLNGVGPGLMKRLVYQDPTGETIRRGGVMSIVLVGGEVARDDEIRVVLPEGPHRPLERL